MRRFFYNYPNLLEIGNTLPVTEDIFHHWCKVLRADVGEQAIFFDGSGGEYRVTLIEVTKKQATVNVDAYDAINRNLAYDAHIALVMSRGERMDYAIQKATELGVASIQLLTSQHSEVRLKADQVDKKLGHWQQIAVSACEQCGLNIVPNLLAPMTFADWLTVQKNESQDMQSNITKLVLAVPNQELISQEVLKNVSSNIENEHAVFIHPIAHILNQFKQSTDNTFWLLIGCEGGFSNQEVNDAIQHGFIPWQIGERVLRTETAPVVALSSLQTLYQTFINAQD